LLASALYIINDICDRERDKLHPRKRFRPIASGAISTKASTVIIVVFALCSVFLSSVLSWPATLILVIYFAMNIAYSFWLKNLPLIDVAVIAFGFVLRVFYGGVVTGTELSSYFLVTIFVVSLFMAFGKRRNELDSTVEGKTGRPVLRYYSRDFLDKNMYVMAAMSLVFYSIWALADSRQNILMLLSIPVVIFILVRYSFVVEKAECEGDPSELILADKPLLVLLALCVLLLWGAIYV
jgi:4-hydroxybenzoate polyprenyltransferase